MIYITGDTHRSFSRIKDFCQQNETTKEDILIILGDSGINYYGNKNGDLKLKKMLRNIPITLFLIRGNHDMSPESIKTYSQIDFHNGKALQEADFPNLIFAIDGEIYDFNNKKTMIIGGAYSIDKHYRLRNGLNWFPDEEPSDEIRKKVEENLEKNKWRIDVMLSHTAPIKYEPTEAFLPNIDQSVVDKGTEIWLDSIEDRLNYDKWYFGHYHIEKEVDKMRCMYHAINRF